jgi:FXSXX-COOH protein
MDGVLMHDQQYGDGQLIDVTAISLRKLQEIESAALRAAVATCLDDDKDQVAAFSNSI